MADRKISDLTALTAPAAGDYLPIVDISEASAANKNKRITIEELLRGAPDGTAAAPSIGFESDPNTGIYRPGADQLAISTGGTGRLFVDASGRVGVGTGSPGSIFDVKPSASASTIRYEVGTLNSDSIRISAGGTVNTYLEYRGYLGHAWFVDATERARIDSSGRLLVGTSSARTNVNNGTPITQIETAVASENTGLSIINNSSVGYTSRLVLGLTSGNSIGSTSAVSNNNVLGYLSYVGADGTKLSEAARIEAQVDSGTVSGTSMPGRLVFSTTPDGASSPTERMRINNAGGSAHFATQSGAGSAVLEINASSGAGTTDYLLWATHSATTVFTGTVALRAYTNGNVQNINNSYGAISDVKYKENIVNAGSQWSDIKSLQVRKYNFKEETGQQTHTQIGLIAQEVELVSPGLVNESPDRDEDGNDLGTVTKSVNYSVLYMKAVKALQEAMERIETLEAKVAALEAA